MRDRPTRADPFAQDAFLGLGPSSARASQPITHGRSSGDLLKRRTRMSQRAAHFVSVGRVLQLERTSVWMCAAGRDGATPHHTTLATCSLDGTTVEHSNLHCCNLVGSASTAIAGQFWRVATLKFLWQVRALLSDDDEAGRGAIYNSGRGPSPRTLTHQFVCGWLAKPMISAKVAVSNVPSGGCLRAAPRPRRRTPPGDPRKAGSAPLRLGAWQVSSCCVGP